MDNGRFAAQPGTYDDASDVATDTATNIACDVANADASDEYFMRLALEEAQRAVQAGEVPVGALVVCEGKVLAACGNRRERDRDPAAHAEFCAMREAARVLGAWRLARCCVYVTLEPCLMCAGLMINARVARCVYGASDPKGGALGTLYDVSHDARLNHEFEVVSGVLREECARLLQDFFRSRRKGGPVDGSVHAEC